MAGTGQDACVVRLTGNPSTGFRWLAEAEHDDLVHFGEGEFQRNATPKDGLVGTRGVYEFRVKPKSADATGKTRVNFFYVQPWTVKGQLTGTHSPHYVLDVDVY